jgi:alpha-beta hydrolase superfamily lysophospholipase
MADGSANQTEVHRSRQVRAGSTEPRHLRAYDEEFDAVRIIREEDGHTSLTVMAHSTGGLIVPLWANRHRDAGVVDAVALNSPWFDLNANLMLRTMGTAAVDRIGRLKPRTIVGKFRPWQSSGGDIGLFGFALVRRRHGSR